MPGVYRALDSDTVGVDGPLQELVARIGAQIAVVRRSIDRLWADQSIETCDDSGDPYIGNLLDVNLVDGLDASAQRLEVAKTIYYRRRKGTVAILEEIATDVTGCQAVIIEAFRRLTRNRHSLDPPVRCGLGAHGWCRRLRWRDDQLAARSRGSDRFAHRHAVGRDRGPAVGSRLRACRWPVR